MAVRSIVLYPDPVLLQPTQLVPHVDPEVRQLVRDMVDTLRAARGVGLAANQIAVSLRVCIVDVSAGEEPAALHVLINPRVVHTAGRQLGEEGCLSFPDITLDIERPALATVQALDLEGKSIEVSGEGLLARALVHECEHLDGKVFLQNVSPLRREMVKRTIRKRMRDGEWVVTETS